MKNQIKTIPVLLASILLLSTALLTNDAAAIQITNEFWISTNSVTTDLGTLDQPFDGSTQTKFDAVMNNMPPNATMHILAGTYQTHGISLPSGVKILGSGIDVTVLQFPNGTPDNNWVIASEGQAGIATTNIEISDLTCDCNYTSGSYTYHGIMLAGTRHAIRRVKLIHQAVMSNSNSESWGLFIANWNLDHSEGNIIEQCEVSQFAAGNGETLDGIGFVNTTTSAPPRGIIRDNRIIGNALANGSSVIGITLATDSLIEGNYVENVLLATHSEQGITNMLFVNNTFKSCGVVIDMAAGSYYRDLTFAYNQIQLTNAGSGAAFRFSQTSATNILVMGNKITLSPGAASGFIYANNVTGLTVIDNMLDSSLNYNFADTVACVNLHIDNNYDLFGNYLSSLNMPTLGGTAVTSLGLSIAGSSSASAALTALGLPSNSQVILTTTNIGTYVFTNDVNLTSSGLGGNAYLTYTNAGGSPSFGFSSSPVIQGGWNNAFGWMALDNTTLNCFANVAFGAEALQLLTNGVNNVAIGAGTLSSETNGSWNVAVGANSMLSSTASANTAVGCYALEYETVGQHNTALGYAALQNATNGESNIAIGAWAGSQLTSGGGNIDIGNYGISSDIGIIRIGSSSQTDTYLAGVVHAPSDLNVAGNLTVSTNLNVTGTNSAAFYTGNGAGLTNLTLPPHPFLFAVLTNTLTISNNIDQRIWFNSNLSSNNINYSTNNGMAIATTGIYQISATVAWQNVNGASSGILYLVKNGADYLRVQSNPTQNNSLTLSTTVPLSAGDTVDFRVWQNFGSTVQIGGNTSPVYQTFLSVLQIQ